MIEIELQPIGLEAEKRPGEDQAELRTFLGRRNLVRLGAPRTGNYRAEKGQLSEEVKRLVKDGFAFHCVRPSLTLLPDRDCAFVSAELSVELSTISPDDAGLPRPIAYEVKPEEIIEEAVYTAKSGRSYEVAGEAKAGFGKLLAKVAQEDSVERGGVRIIRRLYGYGVNFSELGWRLRATPNHELAGDVLGLEFVAQAPADATLAGRFYIAAEVAVHAGADRWLTATFGPRNRGPALEVRYDL